MISQAASFSFDSYKIEGDRKTLSFLYTQDFEGGRTATFKDQIILPEPISTKISTDLLNNILHSLHIMLGISYWKMYCSKELRVETRQLTHDEAEFWNAVYTKGLGEFYYRNEIDFRQLVSFPHGQNVLMRSVSFPSANRSLVGIAGGKDSLVTLELFKRAKKEFTGAVIETNHPYRLIRDLDKRIHLSPLYIRHILDQKIHALNETGLVYNGHVPVSAMYAFIMILVAAAYDYRYVVVSNEKSANIGNVIYHGMEVNHQWSKSEEFELLLRDHIKTYITPDITYFSLLRSMTEIKIVGEFVKYPQYFQYFSSCNKNFNVFKRSLDSVRLIGITGKAGRTKWCGQCPKCAFMFLMLSAFLSKESMITIFGQNLFEHEKLVPLYRQLLGIEDTKPFDCVGTFEEVTVAFYMAYKTGAYNNTPVMHMFEKLVLPELRDVNKLKRHVFEIGDIDIKIL